MPAEIVLFKEVPNHFFPVEADVVKNDDGALPRKVPHRLPLSENSAQEMHGILKKKVPVIQPRGEERGQHHSRIAIQKMDLHARELGASEIQIFISELTELHPIFRRNGDIWISVIIDRENPGAVGIFMSRLRHGECAQAFECPGFNDNHWLPPKDRIV